MDGRSPNFELPEQRREDRDLWAAIIDGARVSSRNGMVHAPSVAGAPPSPIFNGLFGEVSGIESERGRERGACPKNICRHPSAYVVGNKLKLRRQQQQ